MPHRCWCAECGFKTPWLDEPEALGRLAEHYALRHPGTAPGGHIETRRGARTTRTTPQGVRAMNHSPRMPRPAAATGAGAMGIAAGAVVAGLAVLLLLLLTDGNGFGLFGLPVLALGAGLLRNGGRVLAGRTHAGDRLSRLAMIPATVSGLGIGGMVAGADWDRDGTLTQLAGFITTFLLSAVLITLCGRPETKTYLGEH
ncbi:hypothetical protein [Streptomyces yangpuensis]|uniref:hypothetical protein n=1 Tax=Streptomyces yangpuensis TaxID=1648182 RepID=UPI003825D6CF